MKSQRVRKPLPILEPSSVRIYEIEEMLGKWVRTPIGDTVYISKPEPAVFRLVRPVAGGLPTIELLLYPLEKRYENVTEKSSGTYEHLLPFLDSVFRQKIPGQRSLHFQETERINREFAAAGAPRGYDGPLDQTRGIDTVPFTEQADPAPNFELQETFRLPTLGADLPRFVRFDNPLLGDICLLQDNRHWPYVIGRVFWYKSETDFRTAKEYRKDLFPTPVPGYRILVVLYGCLEAAPIREQPNAEEPVSSINAHARALQLLIAPRLEEMARYFADYIAGAKPARYNRYRIG